MAAGRRSRRILGFKHVALSGRLLTITSPSTHLVTFWGACTQGERLKEAGPTITRIAGTLRCAPLAPVDEEMYVGHGRGREGCGRGEHRAPHLPIACVSPLGAPQSVE